MISPLKSSLGMKYKLLNRRIIDIKVDGKPKVGFRGVKTLKVREYSANFFALAGYILAGLSMTQVFTSIEEEVKDGSVAYTPTRPLSYIVYYFFQAIGQNPAKMVPMLIEGFVLGIHHGLVPAALMAYIPARLVRNFDPLLFLILLAADVLLITVAFLVFKRGLKVYESGNRIGTRV